MHMLRPLALTPITALCLGLILGANDALAQQKSLREQLIGTWMLVSNDNVAPDGTKRQLFGPSPKGILILEANGRYAQIQVNPNRPKFKASNRLEGTPVENAAVVRATSGSCGP